MSASPTWAVVATVAEPIELIAAFAAYHIEMGAAQVFLFLDAPRPGDADMLEKLPGVQVICCDAAYWQERLQAARPDSLTPRLRAVCFYLSLPRTQSRLR